MPTNTIIIEYGTINDERFTAQRITNVIFEIVSGVSINQI